MLGWRSGTSISASSFWNFVGDKLDVVDAGLATPLMAATFTFFRSFTSPSGQRWQYPHSLPRMQPWGFQYQAQGLHSTPCRREPGVSAPLRGESSDASEALSLSSTSFPTFLLKARDVTGSFGGSLPSAPDTPDELGLSSSPPSTRLAQLLSISIFFEQVPVSRANEATTNQSTQTLKQKQTSWLHGFMASCSQIICHKPNRDSMTIRKIPQAHDPWQEAGLDWAQSASASGMVNTSAMMGKRKHPTIWIPGWLNHLNPSTSADAKWVRVFYLFNSVFLAMPFSKSHSILDLFFVSPNLRERQALYIIPLCMRSFHPPAQGVFFNYAKGVWMLGWTWTVSLWFSQGAGVSPTKAGK